MTEVPEEVRAQLALALVPGLGPRLTAALLERFGSASAALRATAADLRDLPHIGEKRAAILAAALRQTDPEPELRLLARHGVSVVALGSTDYPQPLTQIAAPPPLLYRRGEWQASDTRAVAIVGSRGCTSYGERVALQLARNLARAGFTIVSGLARGIDAAAHRGALEAGGQTIAVLAGGLSRIYPPEHTDLAEQIVAGHGCLFSETPMGMAPQPGMFPARNRIISGLARAVIVVEADLRSGALITARHAAEQGREVFAVPGPVDSPASAGCLALIRNGARLIRSADDVIEDLKGLATDPAEAKPVHEPDSPAQPTRTRGAAIGRSRGPNLFTPNLLTSNLPDRAASPVASGERSTAPEDPTGPETAPAPLPALTPAEDAVYQALSTRRHADELVRECGLPAGELGQVLMRLELKRVIRRLPGNFYERR